jgi:glycosyltransferase involved in cell wall biosynthesis
VNRKIAFFCGALKEGGAERVISILANHLSEEDYDVEILLLFDKEIFYNVSSKVKITIIEKETGTNNLVKNLLWLHRYFRKCTTKVLSFLAPFNIFALVAALGTHVQLIVADRNDPRYIPVNVCVRKLRDILYHFAYRVVVQTRNNQIYFSQAIQKKSIVIYNPIDLQEKRGLALRTEKKKRIVSVGRLAVEKNQKMLIDAFSVIHKRFPEYELTIYGEGPLREQLESHIKELGLSDYVSLPGNKKEVIALIADAELFVLSSDYEGMPNALIEAMCLGVPVVSTCVSGATDLIEDGKNGLLVEVGNSKALVDGMAAILSDRQLGARMSREAVKLNDVLAVAPILEQWLKVIEL